MTVIACSKCRQEKAATEFHKGRPDCKACRRAFLLRKRDEDPVAWAASLARLQAYAKANPDKQRVSRQQYNERNREQRRAEARAWQQQNKAVDAERSARQRADVLLATPVWANRRYIQMFYEIAKLEEQRTGRRVHVDHIYPLKSPLVCGLHVEDNLQLLFAEDNMAKTNKLHGGGLSLA